MRRKLFGDEHLDINISLLGLVRILQGQGKVAEAEKLALEAAQKCQTEMAHYEKLASDRDRHEECWNFANWYEELGQFFRQIGQPQAAEKGFRNTQLLWRKLVADFNTEDY